MSEGILDKVYCIDCEIKEHRETLRGKNDAVPHSFLHIVRLFFVS